MCFPLPDEKELRSQFSHLSTSFMPATLAIMSSSDGQVYRMVTGYSCTPLSVRSTCWLVTCCSSGLCFDTSILTWFSLTSVARTLCPRSNLPRSGTKASIRNAPSSVRCFAIFLLDKVRPV